MVGKVPKEGGTSDEELNRAETCQSARGTNDTPSLSQFLIYEMVVAALAFLGCGDE